MFRQSNRRTRIHLHVEGKPINLYFNRVRWGDLIFDNKQGLNLWARLTISGGIYPLCGGWGIGSSRLRGRSPRSAHRCNVPHLATFMTLSGTEFAHTRFVIPTSAASTAVCGAATWCLDDHHHRSRAVVAFELFSLLQGCLHAKGDLQRFVQVQFGLRKENLLNVLMLHTAD